MLLCHNCTFSYYLVCAAVRLQPHHPQSHSLTCCERVQDKNSITHNGHFHVRKCFQQSLGRTGTATRPLIRGPWNKAVDKRPVLSQLSTSQMNAEFFPSDDVIITSDMFRSTCSWCGTRSGSFAATLWHRTHWVPHLLATDKVKWKCPKRKFDLNYIKCHLPFWKLMPNLSMKRSPSGAIGGA